MNSFAAVGVVVVGQFSCQMWSWQSAVDYDWRVAVDNDEGIVDAGDDDSGAMNELLLTNDEG